MTARAATVALLRAYQRFVSPLLPPACRFWPTCSEYAVGAVHRHGVVRGSLLAAWRVARCNPWSRGGFDPIPDEEAAPGAAAGRRRPGHG